MNSDMDSLLVMLCNVLSARSDFECLYLVIGGANNHKQQVNPKFGLCSLFVNLDACMEEKPLACVKHKMPLVLDEEQGALRYYSNDKLHAIFCRRNLDLQQIISRTPGLSCDFFATLLEIVNENNLALVISSHCAPSLDRIRLHRWQFPANSAIGTNYGEEICAGNYTLPNCGPVPRQKPQSRLPIR